MTVVDLRSDTITQPTPAMRRAMAEAEVGDDVFGEDPTVRKLEEMAADRLGKEAALFTASGTMGNMVSLLTHCGRGDEMILGDQSHIFFYEQGGSAALGGIHPRTVPNQPDGTILIEDLEGAIRQDDVHFPVTRIIALENTHNRCCGSPLCADYMKDVGNLAGKHGLKIHVDGARIFNAAAALDTDVKDLAEYADSISFCLSKGLGSPAGSVVCGTKDFIARARRARKVLGGGMRQAGILAGAGIISLTQMTERLAEDHENAGKLAQGLAHIEGLSVDLANIKTNIVFFDLKKHDLSTESLVKQLEEQGIRILALGPRKLRAVTHYHISSKDIDHVLDSFKSLF
ncbi:Low specificity L-threonine aldolase [Desulfonema limicola]|uniref:Low specificity L-threonine aldolase n=1 Tax=Desulfonema limicola TaxID=45656 RepID=A0A975B869_9BACT|nr:low-specificity L-threonine aldolase [Desulfonema limicola]QTA80513.1 Low specificity L-threonine aldolase [Desulfonema limicola]